MGKIILIVEDRTDSREMIKIALENAGYQTLEASGGEEALGVLKTKSVDLLITDIRMPKMNGMELLKAVRAEQKNKKLKIVMLTASKTANDEKKVFLDAGADDFLMKPIDVIRLREVVKRIIG